ncbi:ABC transporter substrate-binding protein [Actinomadura parmotrematis]|uniref:ABC transporter substrate-binding protein n=1 Tax=Actinomadura parmotrematis TaxID=2864039 RepID=A0ABS7G5Q0_9ACTN|nr:ABC transporter substrate-binding protein [Actinomadura parmotrematis]MBW8487209.1 ABC transporter substrate-binding protein [Actinomadura parmotrematis]
MTRPRSAAPAALAVSAALALAACTTSSSSGGGDGAKGSATFRFAATSDANTFDPAKGTASTDYAIARLQYATLINRDNGNKIIAGLAEKWQAAPTTGTFTLRAGLTCSDGTPLTATAVAASLKRWADPRNGGSGYVYAFGQGTPTITADDAARTVTVALAKPWSDLLVGLSLPNAGIVCPSGLKDPKALAQGPVKGAGTGAYTLTDARRGQSYTFERRDGYKAAPVFAGAAAGSSPAGLRLSIVSNESTAANQLSTGQLDYAPLTGPDAARFAKGGYGLKSAPLLRMFLVFNEREGRPGADPAVRRAVAQAVDPAAFNKVFGGKGQVMRSWSDSGSQCVNTDASLVPATDAAAARKKLAGVKIKLVGTNAIANGSGNAYVQEALRAAGADVALRNVDNATWATDVLADKGDWDVTVMAHLNFAGTLTSGALLLTGPTPPQGRNFGGITNTAFAAGIGKAMAAGDEAAKCAGWAEAQKALLERADVVPLATVPVAFVFGENADGAIVNGTPEPSTFRIKS